MERYSKIICAVLLQCCACTLRFLRITKTTTIDTLSISILTGITYKLNNLRLTSFLIGCWLCVILILSRRVCHRAPCGYGLSTERFRIALTAVNGTQKRDSCWQSLKLEMSRKKLSKIILIVDEPDMKSLLFFFLLSFQNRMRTFTP